MMPPNGWSASTVSEICEMRNGTGFGPDDWDVEGLPIIRIQNLNGGLNFDYFSGEADPKWIVEPGQLLFAWAGTRGVSFGPTVWAGPRGVLNQHIFKVNAKQGIDGRWLYWALREVTNRIEGQAHGFKATLLHVKKSDIDRQLIFLPPKTEQRRLATVLDTWDEAISAIEKLLANSCKQKQALMFQLLTGKRRLRRFQRTTSLYATPHGTISADWSYPRICAVAEEVSFKHSSGSDFPVLSCTKHDGLVDSLKYFNKRVFSEDLSTYKVVPRGSFVYATNHIEEGSIGYQNLYDFGLVSPMYTVFRRTNCEVDDGYLYRLLKTEHYRQIFSATTNASVDRRGSLRWKEFKKLHIPLPSIEEQRAIASVLDLADQELKLFEGQLKSLHEEKAALMQQLLTGKRRAHLPEVAP